jgi:hypothetical protein
LKELHMTVHANPPACCDICKAPIRDSFTDAFNPSYRTWANHCPICAEAFDTQLGTGKGQRYDLQSDGRFHKVTVTPVAVSTVDAAIAAWLLDDDFDSM